jgi:hypothetical protein
MVGQEIWVRLLAAGLALTASADVTAGGAKLHVKLVAAPGGMHFVGKPSRLLPSPGRMFIRLGRGGVFKTRLVGLGPGGVFHPGHGPKLDLRFGGPGSKIKLGPGGPKIKIGPGKGHGGWGGPGFKF